MRTLVVAMLIALAAGCGDEEEPIPCPSFCTPPGGGDASASLPEAGVQMICNIPYPTQCGTDETCLVNDLCGGIEGQVDLQACTYSCRYP